jgi:hypothetical protein
MATEPSTTSESDSSDEQDALVGGRGAASQQRDGNQFRLVRLVDGIDRVVDAVRVDQRERSMPCVLPASMLAVLASGPGSFPG